MKHVCSIVDANKSWCGEPITLTTGETPFRSLDQLAFNGMFPGDTPKTVCSVCLNHCVESLLKNCMEEKKLCHE